MYWARLFNDFEPWRELTRLQYDVNRLFDDVSVPRQRSFPEINPRKNDSSALVTAELSGLDSKDIHLSVHDQNLVIEGERVAHELKENECCHRQERGIGSFKRTVQLPFAVDADKIDTNFKNGILSVNLPRAEEDKPKRIEIK